MVDQLSHEKDIYVAVYHRGPLSHGDERIARGTNAFHWAIHVDLMDQELTTKYQCLDIRHVANPAASSNPVGVLWKLRSISQFGLKPAPRLVCRIKVGTIIGHDIEGIENMLKRVPLPDLSVEEFRTDVTDHWIRRAITLLQEEGHVEEFDEEWFMDSAVAYADERLQNHDPKKATIHYYGL